MQHPIVRFSLALFVFYALFWGAQALFPEDAADTAVVVLVTIVGVVLTQPGWNVRPSCPVRYWMVLLGVLLGSAVPVAYVLRLLKVSTPYDTMTLNSVILLPGVFAVAGLEELLFRQVMFRWLEQQSIVGRGSVLATAIAFGCAHLGPVFTGGTIDGAFYLLQSLYMVWIGLLLGELRRASDSWVISWIGHAGYNVTVLFLISLQGKS